MGGSRSASLPVRDEGISRYSVCQCCQLLASRGVPPLDAVQAGRDLDKHAGTPRYTEERMNAFVKGACCLVISKGSADAMRRAVKPGKM